MIFTERLARWAAQRPRRVLTTWLVVVAGLAVAAGAVGSVSLSDVDKTTGDAAAATRILQAAGLRPEATETVVVTARDGGPLPPDTGSRVEHLAQRLAAVAAVGNVRWQGPELVSADGRARLITFDLARGDSTPEDALGPVLETVRAVQQADGTLRYQQVGDASINHDIATLVDEDLGASESVVMPMTLVILLITFGALVAAGLPLVLGAVSVVTALSLAGIASHLVPQSDSATSFVSMLGIALGVDYTLFLLRREREERAAGRSPRQALARAAASSGYAVFVSGMIVFIALTGLLVSGSKVFVSMGVSAMFVVAAALVGALVALPAILAVLGDRVEAGDLRRLLARLHRGPRDAAGGRDGAGRAESRAWRSVVHFAVRRPLLTAAVSGGLLAVACLPALDLETGDPTLSGFPADLPAVAAYRTYAQHFGTGADPVLAAVTAGTSHAAGTKGAAVEEVASAFARRASEAGLAVGPVQQVPSTDGATRLVLLHLAADGRPDASQAAVQDLRTIGQTVAVPGVRVLVGGAAAMNLDFAESLEDHLPWVFLVVLGSAFLLLTMAFRSIVVPAVAVGLNLLSVGAAYGFLVWGFQQRHLDGLVDVAGTGTVISWLPLFLFVLLFGLSMDYHVFLLSRIRERVLAGSSTRDAIVSGISASASTISSAAVIMVGVFAGFSTSRLAELQQMGAGLAVAVLVDATIVRGLLLPAVMSLIGQANWYLPRSLRWLPGLRLDQAEGSAPSTAKEVVAP